jgi:small conductance mechanosensitive channel
VNVGVAYDSNLAEVLPLVKEVVLANSRVLAEPAPLVGISALGDSAVQITVRPWVAVSDYGTVVGELNLALVEKLRERGVGIPFPQQEIRLLNAA